MMEWSEKRDGSWAEEGRWGAIPRVGDPPGKEQFLECMTARIYQDISSKLDSKFVTGPSLFYASNWLEKGVPTGPLIWDSRLFQPPGVAEHASVWDVPSNCTIPNFLFSGIEVSPLLSCLDTPTIHLTSQYLDEVLGDKSSLFNMNININ
jgi:hypothetical protein